MQYHIPRLIRLTRHCQERSRLRAIPPEAIALALEIGAKLHLCSGRRGRFLGKRQLERLPFAQQKEWERFARCGVLLVLSADCRTVITAYRCEHPSVLRRARA